MRGILDFYFKELKDINSLKDVILVTVFRLVFSLMVIWLMFLILRGFGFRNEGFFYDYGYLIFILFYLMLVVFHYLFLKVFKK